MIVRLAFNLAVSPENYQIHIKNFPSFSQVVILLQKVEPQMEICNEIV